MNTQNQPVRTTIIFGLICGLLFIPLGMGVERIGPWPVFFRMFIFGCLAVYALIMAGWTRKRRIQVIFPLVFLAFFAFGSVSTAAFLLLCLGMLAWMRSGICFERAFARSLGAELMFTIGGGVLVVWFAPHSIITWALGIWMFFLVQSMYFLLMTDPEAGDRIPAPDAFDEARMRAENILKA